jgi:hypothetical protein
MGTSKGRCFTREVTGQSNARLSFPL